MKRTYILSFILGATLLVTGSVVGSKVQKKNKEQAKQKVEDYTGPVVNYDTAFTTQSTNNGKEQRLKDIRASRYSSRAPQPLADFASVEFAIHTDWEIGLTPLPIAQSDAVVLGRVLDAQAYLSKDGTGVFSEFKIVIDRIFKDSTLRLNDSIITEREGGVVQFSSGRLLPYRIFGQRLPRAGRQYVIFLKKNQQGEDYHIITGYEIHSGRVKALDEPSEFSVFEGMSKAQFLKLVQETTGEFN